MSEQRSAFETHTLHRMCAQAARYWVIENWLRTNELPEPATYFAYPTGPGGFDWGDAPGNDGPPRPLRGKRVRITLEIEEE